MATKRRKGSGAKKVKDPTRKTALRPKAVARPARQAAKPAQPRQSPARTTADQRRPASQATAPAPSKSRATPQPPAPPTGGKGAGLSRADQFTPSQPSLLERAKRLRDDVQRSKVAHPDPWGYTAKARAWGERAQQFVADAAAGRDIRRALDTLIAEVEGDRDFQQAKRLF